MKAAVVFAAGPLSPGSLESLRPHVIGRVVDGRQIDVFVAADGGLDLALELGVEPDLVIGDMDSVNPNSLEETRADGVEIREYPTAKDESDYELAIQAAVNAGARRVTVVGSDSGRLDHLYATLFTLCAPKFSALTLDARLGGNYLAVLNGAAAGAGPGPGEGPQATPDSVVLEGPVGTQVSLFAVNGTALGVTTTGLRWPLAGDSLEPGSSLGVSNELSHTSASVRIVSGCLAVVVPTAPEPH